MNMTGSDNSRDPEAVNTGAACHGAGVSAEAGPSFSHDRAQLARWAKEDRFRMRYGVLAVLAGWFVTFLVFCLGLVVVSAVADGVGVSAVYLLPVFLMYGLPVAAIIGLPLAMVLAGPLRRVRDQRVHVVVFAVGVGTAMSMAALFAYQCDMPWAVAGLSAWAAVSAAIGRASVIKMVARSN